MLADKDFYQIDKPNWMSGQPDTLWYTPGCGVMYSSGQWADSYCDALHTPVCSNVTGQNVAFVFINTPMSWTDAQRYCREHLTDLAIPRNLSENEKIRAVIPGGVYSWIGLYRDTWKWSDGSMYVFNRWTSGQPDAGEEKCAGAMFGYSGYWGNWPCYTRQPFICHHGELLFCLISMHI
ncbi:hypothetical protein CHARACLAT_033641 [Characodon lateralis]|uniref:C-type lectin domain-containing protein n=1 Tax=Characodon lateralis TaxID=208331 RepID=A0ABU7D5P1_9TELE|nr:hypothetical protein [Characodon lateralis]